MAAEACRIRGRLRRALVLGAVFVSGIAFLPALLVALWLADRPATAAQDASTTETYRLLTLFGDVFERARQDYVFPVSDRTLIENAINGMLSGLDPHSSYITPAAFREMQAATRSGVAGIGLELTIGRFGRVVVVSPIDGSPAARAGLRPGDVITAIDGKTVEGLSLADVIEKLRGPPQSDISLTIRREWVDEPIQKTLLREILHLQPVVSRMEPGQVGYVRLAQFAEHANVLVQNAVTELRVHAGGKLTALILDLRNNPGGLVDTAIAVSREFMDHGEIASTRSRYAADSQRWDAHGTDIIPGTPIVVLVNDGSAAASEIVAGALQDNRRAVIVGTQTFGDGSIQTVIPLPGNGAMRLTTALYYTPSGRSIQQVGITPDVCVPEVQPAGASFAPKAEADLQGALKNPGATAKATAAQCTDMAPVAHAIRAEPQMETPALDLGKRNEMDFQLQQAIVLARSMAARQTAPATK